MVASRDSIIPHVKLDPVLMTKINEFEKVIAALPPAVTERRRRP